MNVPAPLEITASLMAGYRFTDGSLLEVDGNGDYRITNEHGDVLAETVDTKPGEFAGLHCYARGGVAGPPLAEDYGEIMDDLAAFLMYDADGVDDPSDYENGTMFGLRAKAWAQEHYDDLSMLACYRADRDEEE